MKELVKPNLNEQVIYDKVESYCEMDCDRTSGRICNKHCEGAGTTNGSVDDGDILF